MQADAVADQPRRDYHAFQQLPHSKHEPHQRDARKLVKLSECSKGGQCQAGEHAEIGHEYQHARHHAYRQRKFQAGQP